MHPTLLDLPLFGRRFALDAQGLFVTLGAIFGLLLALRLRTRARLPVADLRDLGLELILVGVVGARLLFLVVHWRATVPSCAAMATGEGTLGTCLQPLWLWEGGLSFIGGLLIGIAWLLWRAPHRGLPPLSIADQLAPGLALAQSIAAIGTYLAGSAFGAPTSSPLGVRFPDGSVAYQAMLERGLIPPGCDTTPPLHPLQVYDAVGHAALLAVLLLVGRRNRREGTVFAVYLVGHATLRLTLDPFLATGERAFVFGHFSFEQLVAMVFLAVAVVLTRGGPRSPSR